MAAPATASPATTPTTIRTSAKARRRPALRVLAPGVVLTTLALFGTGVALLFAGPPSNTLIFAHKLSFFAWVALMTLHVLGHLLELPRLASADWRRRARARHAWPAPGCGRLPLAGAIAARRRPRLPRPLGRQAVALSKFPASAQRQLSTTRGKLSHGPDRETRTKRKAWMRLGAQSRAPGMLRGPRRGASP